MRHHVVPMINNRGVREAVGYDLERCIRLKILPCKLVTDEIFTEHLEHLCDLRADWIGTINVYYPDEQVRVVIRFYNDPQNDLLRDLYLKLYMIVETRQTMTFKCTMLETGYSHKPPMGEKRTYLMDEKRTYLMDPFESTFLETGVRKTPFKVLSVDDADNQFVRVSGSDLLVPVSQAERGRHRPCS